MRYSGQDPRSNSPNPPIDPEKPSENRDGGLPSRTQTPEVSQYLYFFPQQRVTEEYIRGLLEYGSIKERAWVITNLLQFAQWDDIWRYVSKEEAAEIFSHLDLPERLEKAWGRMLGVPREPVD